MRCCGCSSTTSPTASSTTACPLAGGRRLSFETSGAVSIMRRSTTTPRYGTGTGSRRSDSSPPRGRASLGPGRGPGRRRTAVKSSTERILTTHTGSLPRPPSLADRHDPAAICAAVEEIVRLQISAGIDIINDGEASKQSYATYVTERLSGFEGGSVPLQMGARGLPGVRREDAGRSGSGSHDGQPQLQRPRRLPRPNGA